MIDICTLNASGNLIDVSALGALAAIKNAVYPEYDKETGKVDYGKKTKKKIEMAHQPIAITIWKIGDYMLVDPLSEEEQAADARLTITTTAEGNVASLQKGGDASLTIEEIDLMIGIALDKAKELRNALG